MNGIRAVGAIFANLDDGGPRLAADKGRGSIYLHHVAVAQ
ncbi:hypothetical protein AXXA_29140 [Achromobacter insuavis AXX-A]|uniref:Uncharacterized protein n=1 Tax=Achromobacter insuavis AXX-A TaxID=1003200 RepID=F7TA28_9BURK|nr:hypothetical protein AXXA_29140 [Achromobacter insuavis AXX-A]